MSYPRISIIDTPPELYHVALLAIKAVSDYHYSGRKNYTMYFYNKYKCKISKNMNGWAVKVSEI